MDTSKFDQQAQAEYNNLVKQLEQSTAVENLVRMEEWAFWDGWLRSAHNNLSERLANTPEFVNNRDGYLYILGKNAAYKEQLDAIDQFIDKGAEARKKLKEWEEHNREQ